MLSTSNIKPLLAFDLTHDTPHNTAKRNPNRPRKAVKLAIPQPLGGSRVPAFLLLIEITLDYFMTYILESDIWASTC